MLNITIQCCALFMLIVVFLIFINERALDLSSRRLYFYALISSIVCLSLDILSITGIYFAGHSMLPPMIARLICKLYVISLVVQSYEGFFYAAGEFFSAWSHQKLRKFYNYTLIVAIILIAVLPIDYYTNGRVVYSLGSSTIVTYLFALLYIGSTVAIAIWNTDLTSRRRRRAILLWEFSWLAAAVIQLFNPELLLVGFFAAFGMMILYAELENPHEGIDRSSVLFTSNAFLDYVNDRYQHRKQFSCISIRYEHPNHATDWERERTILVRAANYFKTFTNAYVFRNDENEFILIFSKRDDMEKALGAITVNIYDAIDIPLRYRYVIIPDSLIAQNSDEFFKLHRRIYHCKRNDRIRHGGRPCGSLLPAHV